MSKGRISQVKQSSLRVITKGETDFISLTDIARHIDTGHTDSIIQNWMKNRNTIELLGFWETIYNLSFKSLEFEGYRKQAGLIVL